MTVKVTGLVKSSSYVIVSSEPSGFLVSSVSPIATTNVNGFNWTYDTIVTSGSGFTGTTHVLIGGVSVDFYLDSGTQITVTLQEGMRSGGAGTNTVVVGAHGEDDAGGTESGKVYIYQLS